MQDLCSSPPQRRLTSCGQGLPLCAGPYRFPQFGNTLSIGELYGLTVTLLLPLICGSTGRDQRAFAPRTVLNNIERHRVTCIVAVPSQFRVLTMESTTCDGSSLWLCIAGAECLPDTVEREFTARFGRSLLPGCGATELSPVVLLNVPETRRRSEFRRSRSGSRVPTLKRANAR
jgi:acyl-CoA synthetase (AMP-forming)/AMP-acid ligase II